jgi:hypothetical protein
VNLTHGGEADITQVKVKVKVKLTLEQVTKAQRGVEVFL